MMPLYVKIDFGTHGKLVAWWSNVDGIYPASAIRGASASEVLRKLAVKLKAPEEGKG